MSKISALAVVAVASVLAMPASALAAPSPAADDDQPLLSIAVDNGRTAVAAGDELTYKITLRNVGTTTAEGLEITQSLPAGLALIRAGQRGTARPGRVVWSVDLTAGKAATFTTVTRLGRTSDALLRLATVACATVAGGEKPLVCATHSDLLPAGTVAAAGDKSDSRIWYGLAAVAGLVILGLVAAVGIRRRRRRDQPLPEVAAESESRPADASMAE